MSPRQVPTFNMCNWFNDRSLTGICKNSWSSRDLFYRITICHEECRGRRRDGRIRQQDNNPNNYLFHRDVDEVVVINHWYHVFRQLHVQLNHIRTLCMREVERIVKSECGSRKQSTYMSSSVIEWCHCVLQDIFYPVVDDVRACFLLKHSLFCSSGRTRSPMTNVQLVIRFPLRSQTRPVIDTKQRPDQQVLN